MPHPTLQTLAHDLQQLAGRMDALEADLASDARKRLGLLAGEHALREGLLQFAQELAARGGCAVPLFVSRFEAAIDWHRDRFLRTVEGVDPQLAAEIDERPLARIPTTALPPSILPGGGDDL